jgi:hypothetical protein
MAQGKSRIESVGTISFLVVCQSDGRMLNRNISSPLGSKLQADIGLLPLLPNCGTSLGICGSKGMISSTISSQSTSIGSHQTPRVRALRERFSGLACPGPTSSPKGIVQDSHRLCRSTRTMVHIRPPSTPTCHFSRRGLTGILKSGTTIDGNMAWHSTPGGQWSLG